MDPEEMATWEVKIEHFGMQVKVWPWVCFPVFTTAIFCDRWRIEFLMLTVWPFFSFIGSLFAMLILALLHGSTRAFSNPVTSRRIAWVFFIASDAASIFYVLRDATNLKVHMFP